jgi:hypothetical protein
MVFVYRNPNGLQAVRTWNGTSWSTVATAIPNLQELTSIAYDPVRDRVVLIQRVGPMYEWDRVAWVPKAPSPAQQDAYLCWDPARQRVITVVDSGIHEWDGTAWTLVPGSALPYSFAYGNTGGLRFALDRARNAIVGIGTTTGLQYLTVEWTGAQWAVHPMAGQALATGTWDLHVVDAPALGGVVGYQINALRTWRWSPTTQQWEDPGFGGTPGPFYGLELAYDDLRGRLVMSNTQSLAEYDPSLVYAPRTFFVDPFASAGYISLADALAVAVDGDRIVVAAGLYSPTTATISVGVRIDCAPGAHLAGAYVSWLSPGREVAWTGGIVQTIVCQNTAGRVRLKGVTTTLAPAPAPARN